MPDRMYIINIEGVGHRWINNPQNIVNTIREFISRYGIEIVDIRTLEQLDGIIRNPIDNIVLINGHGETLPIPISWNNDWHLYITKISSNIIEHGWIVASITGMPFWCYASNSIETEMQWGGLNELLRSVDISVSPQSMYGWVEISKFGKTLSTLYDYDLSELVLCTRFLRFSNLMAVSKSMYRIGELSGLSAIKMGNGYFIHNGLSAQSIIPNATSPTEETDEEMAMYTIIFILGIIKSNEKALELYTKNINNEDLLRKNIIIPLFRLKGFKNVIDVHGTDEHGRDVVCYINDFFDNRINIGIQIKAKKIHCTVKRKGTVNEIITQLNEAFRMPFRDIFTTSERMIHQMYIVSSKEVTPTAQAEIISGNYDYKNFVHFMDGKQLEDEWIKAYQL